MTEYISFDSHKHYTLVERQDSKTGRAAHCRLPHSRGVIYSYLLQCEPGTAVAVEATGNWYWIVDEIEQAGLRPLLVHPRKAKLMMGLINKTDKLDVHGLNTLQRNRTLPTVWIPPAPLRDLRELSRARMVVAEQRTRLKNRITSTLSRYGWPGSEWSDPYGKKARPDLEQELEQLPPETRWVSRMPRSAGLDFIAQQIQQQEQRLRELVEVTPEMQGLLSLPGIGVILAAVIALEIGDIRRFPSAAHLAAYAGTTPRVEASGGRVRYGRLRPDVNHYLKWAFAEAANSVCVNRSRCSPRHVNWLYARLRARKGHGKAIGAVARHLAEAAFYVLSRQEPYRDPAANVGRTTEV